MRASILSMKGRAIAEVWYASGTVIAVSFEDDRNAYEALTLLKELDSQGQIDVMGAAIVTREEDGQLVIKDEVNDDDWPGMAGGGVIGLLIGVGGPLGVLIRSHRTACRLAVRPRRCR